MAALMQGVQYGLSSQGTFEENKSLIFVKLTDSAYRAIEDYLKNKNRISATPKIQFLGNEGHLSFPSTNETSHRFTFSLNNNADIEGPQGSFECIQKTGSKNLESLGALQCKMRIQAKDDVYEATRHRMAVAEEAQKKNRTREIKPGGPGIGKKVKLTPGAAPRRSHDPSPTAPPSSLGVIGADSVSPALRPSYGSSAKTLGGLPNGFHHHNGAVNGSAAGRGPNGHRYPVNPEIMKRPIRERLIHMLAVRNYKKPELVDRLHRDGLKDRDRKIMPEALKQVSMLRDNSYQLLRHLWNDVQENWPFYSEQERQSLKRRRPQNLTPPGGSDGGSSSGSGQSPTSTHPGSPPPPTVKRPGYVDGADGLPTKRPRISHYKRPTPTPPEDSGGDRGGGGGLGGGGLARWAGGGSGGGGSAAVAARPQQQHLPPLPSTRASSAPPPPPSYAPPLPAPPPAAPVPRPAPPPAEEERPVRRPPLPAEPAPPAPPVPAREVVREAREFREARDFREFRESREAVRDVARSAREAARDVTVRGDLRDESSNESLADAAPPQQEYPEYLSSYTTILDSEQRSRYKADFNADYNEYRDLHAAVENVSRHFAELEERLRQEEVNSPGWRSIKQQIMREYQENKRDQQHQEAKRRFQYLHEKLSHIKRLVQEYDSELAGQQY